MITVVVSGVVVGTLYLIVGLSLAAIYRASKVLNFALGGMGAVAVYVGHELLDAGVPYGLVFLVAVLVGAALGVLTDVAVARPLRQLPPLTIAVGTLGVLLILQGALIWRYGSVARPVPQALPDGGGIRIDTFFISANQVLILGIGAVAALLLFALIYRTRLGLAMRATQSGPQTSALLGVNVSNVRLAAWAVGGAYGGLAALLVIPLTYLSPSSFTVFLLTAFAAVVLGGFTSLSGIAIGSIVVGVGINLLQVYLSPGLTDAYTFLVLALVLVLRPHGLFGKREHETPEPPPIPGRRARRRPARAPIRVSGPVRVAGWVGLLGFLAVLPLALSGPDTYLLATVLAMFIAVLGLDILGGYAGQVSLGHGGFLAVGAYVSAILAQEAGIPVLLTLPLALLAGGVAGLLIGLPATRLSGLYLGLLTLTFAFAVPELILYGDELTGGSNGMPLALPSELSDPRAQYWLVLAIASAVAAVTLLVGASRLGRAWRAVRDSEDGAQALGLDLTRVKLSAFTWSSALGALGGALSGMLVGFVAPATYGIFLSVYLLVAVVVGGPASVLGSLLGAAFITLVPHYTSSGGPPPDLFLGIALIATLLLAPNGLAAAVASVAARIGAVVASLGVRLQPVGAERVDAATRTHAAPLEDAVSAARSVRAAGTDGGETRQGNVETAPCAGEGRSDKREGDQLLALDGVYGGYGIVEVLHDISLDVWPGEVVALIGANGAGKSTLLRVISGAVPITRGVVRWQGQDLAKLGRGRPHRIARLGISHVPEGRGIFPDLTVSENLTMGTFSSRSKATEPPTRGMALDEVLDHFPRLRERRRQRAGTLSGGEQQMLAIARALVGRPQLLILDEPSLGLAPVVTQQVYGILRDIAAGGVPILLAEQNARAALALADRAYVLAGGQVALDGAAADLQQTEDVTHAYLAMTPPTAKSDRVAGAAP
jgi:ABC-type branched-subunit amino acid transport system ATPase component/ABC-type branched-subunit amino acid transport system permease subunit